MTEEDWATDGERVMTDDEDNGGGGGGYFVVVIVRYTVV